MEKEFEGHGVSRGRITGFFTKEELDGKSAGQGYYHVVYEDDDEEEIPEAELPRVLKPGFPSLRNAESSRPETDAGGSGSKVVHNGGSKEGGGRQSGKIEAAKGIESEEDKEWTENFRLLEIFVEENGHPHVPTGCGLWQWVLKIRDLFKR